MSLSTSSPNICDTCHRTLPDLILRQRFKHNHHASLRALQASSLQGCRTCAIFYHNFAYIRYKKETLEEGPVAIGRSAKDDTFKVSLSGEHSEVTYGAEIPFSIQNAQSAQQGLQSRLSEAADSEENIALVKSLLKDCRSNHPLCTAGSGSLDTPSRVLNICSAQDEEIVRIVPGSEMQAQGGRYVCLSHCWGIVPQDAPWKLTEARKKAYMMEISMAILPLTFQQAIQYTRSLGEKYLWIDSLCIIQDSAADWATEAAKMAGIYANSILTISAATSSSLEGCIVKREPVLLEPVVLSLGKNEVDGQKAFIYHGMPAEKQVLQTVPVTSRAWCLQERKLTVRLVQFTKFQWTWNCITASTSERILRKFNITANNFSSVSLWGLTFHNHEDKSGSLVARSDGDVSDESAVQHYKDSRKAYDPWYTVVQDFTNCAITYASDRLPALAGLAYRQRSLVPDTYLAGLWRSDIHHGLLWSSRYPPRSRPATYIAPSWSWASLNSAVMFEGFLHFRDAYSPTLVSASITHDSPDTLGVIKTGHIRLLGRLKRVPTSTPVPAFGATFREFPTGYGPGILRLDTFTDVKDCADFMCLTVRGSRGVALRPVVLGEGKESEGGGMAYRRIGAITCPVQMWEGVQVVEFDVY